jgi:hypothetical protein
MVLGIAIALNRNFAQAQAVETIFNDAHGLNSGVLAESAS